MISFDVPEILIMVLFLGWIGLLVHQYRYTTTATPLNQTAWLIR